MSDEMTISDYSTNAPPVYRITTENGKTILRDYSTNAPRFVINGEIGGGTATAMTTAQRTAITPSAGQLIYDTDLGALFVGDGSTVGGKAVGGGSGGDIVFSNEFDTSGDVVSINQINGSKITTPVNSATNATNAQTAVTAGTASVYGGTVGYAVNAGTASVAGTAAAVTQTVSSAIVAEAVASAGGAYTGPFAVSSAGSHYDSGIDVAISGGKVVFNGSAYTAPSVASNTLYLSSGQRLYVYISSGGTPSYTTSEPDYPLSNEWYTMIAENKAGKLVQTQVGDIYITVGGGASGDAASAGQVMQVPSDVGGTDNLVDVKALRGALTAGQAVDVTSKPDNFTGDNWRGYFTWDQATLGFALFPKYAPDLTYLLIADMAIMSDFGSGVSGTITPAGTWLDGSRTTRTILDTGPGYTRIAMLFSTSSSCKLNFTYTGTGAHWDIRYLREYEVTSLTAEGIAYIAALDNPDAFADYYLVKQDMVQPWTKIIDMLSSPAVTIASGLSYKLNATGTHQLTVDSCPADCDGRDAIIRIRLSGNGVIQAVAPLQLGGALVPYAINNCVVRFRDGEAVLLVEDTLAGYVVTLTSGTDEGSLPYGLASTGVPYIGFSPTTDGIPVGLSGATTAAEEVTVVGNGYEETILTGSITCTSKTFMANLALSDVGIKGGTMTLGDVFIPSGSTVSCAGGGLAIEKVTGDGETSVIDLGLTNINVASDATVSGCTISGGRATIGGAMLVSKGKSADVTSCVFAGNSATGSGGAVYNFSGTVDLTGCTFTGNYSPAYGLAVLNNGGVVYLNGCAFGAGQSVTNAGAGATTIVSGSCAVGGTLAKSGAYGTLLISAGAVIDATGNTNNTVIIQSAGGCKVGSGTPDNWVVNGTATFKNSAGAEIDLSGTFTSVTKAGVVS